MNNIEGSVADYLIQNVTAQRIVLSLNKRTRSVYDIAQELGLSTAMVNHYIRKLLEMGVVIENFSRVVGNNKEVFYGLTTNGVQLHISPQEGPEKQYEWLSKVLDEYKHLSIEKSLANLDHVLAADHAFLVEPERINEISVLLKQFTEKLEELEVSELISNSDQKSMKAQLYRCLVLFVPS